MDDILLSVSVYHVSRLDPSSALDFLWACSHIPRIWQGRDQKIPQVRSKVPAPGCHRCLFLNATEAREFIPAELICISRGPCRRKPKSVCSDSVPKSSSAWWTWSCRSRSSTVATPRTMTKADWTRPPAPSSSPGCPSFTPTAAESWKTLRKSPSTSSTAQRNGRTGTVYIYCCNLL